MYLVLILLGSGIERAVFANESPDFWEKQVQTVFSEDETMRSSGWSGIGRCAEYCPAHRSLKRTLLTVLKDTSYRDRWEAAFAYLEASLKCDPTIDKSDVEFIINNMSHYQLAEADAAVGCLGAAKAHSKEILPHLEECLSMSERVTIEVVASAILRLNPKHENALKILLAGLRSKEKFIRQRSAYWLGITMTIDADAIKSLKHAISDEDSSVRVLSACALLGLGYQEPSILEIVVKCFDDEPTAVLLTRSRAPSLPLVPQHRYALISLGNIAATSTEAKKVIQLIAERKYIGRMDWNTNLPFLLMASAKAQFGAVTQLEAYVAIAEQVDDPLRDAARRELGSRSTEEVRKLLLQWRTACNARCTN
jgi:hypothetical protein